MTAPTALRVRKIVGDEIVSEEMRPVESLVEMADDHAEWAGLCSREGVAWRIVVDDPDVDVTVVTMDDDVMRQPMRFFEEIHAGLARLYEAHEGPL